MRSYCGREVFAGQGYDVRPTRKRLCAPKKVPVFKRKRLRVAKEPRGLSRLVDRFLAYRAGVRDAKRNEPSDKTPFQTVRELDILQERTALVKPVENSAIRIRNELRDALSRAQPLPITNRATQTASNSSTDKDTSSIESKYDAAVASLRHSFHDRTERARKDFENTEHEYNNFRHIHGLLDREPQYARDWSKPLFVLIGLFVLEGLLNATFFAGASDMGMLGGAIVAFVLAFINITIGFTIGLVSLRLLSHTVAWRRLFARFTLGIGVIALIVLNFTVAHYREYAERQFISGQSETNFGTNNTSIESVSMGSVLSHMIENPFYLGSIMSYLLLVIGLLIGILSMVEGYRGLFGNGFFDKYWGYANVHRRYQKAKNTLDQLNRLRAQAEQKWALNAQSWVTANVQMHKMWQIYISSLV